MDRAEHLLRLEFRRGQIGRDTATLRLESVAVVAARAEKKLAARLHRLGISCEWIDRARRIGDGALICRRGAENAHCPAHHEDKENGSYRHVDQRSMNGGKNGTR